MEFGMQFFPDVGEAQKSGAQYFDEALRLVELCDLYHYTHVRTVEHYFHPYGGYSPNPHVFLAAAAQRTNDYTGYDKVIAALSQETFASQVAKGAAWVGTPADLIAQIEAYQQAVGGFEDASLQVNFNTITYEDAARSVRLFGEAVIPHCTSHPATPA